jgi:hypothetical protein
MRIRSQQRGRKKFFAERRNDIKDRTTDEFKNLEKQPAA